MERLFTSAKQFCKSDSPETTKSYRLALTQFGQSKFGGELPREKQLALTQDDVFPQLDQYIRQATKQDVLDDLRNFKDFLDDLEITKKIGGQIVTKKYEVATKTLRIYILQSWLEKNEIGIPKAYRSEFTYKEKPAADDMAFTHETALAVYHQLKSPIARCFFMFLLSTGCRIKEATSVQLSEITWEYRLPDGSPGPVRIRLDGAYTKNGKPRTVFLTKEAEELLREIWTDKLHRRIFRRGPHKKRNEIWKNGRDLYLISIENKLPKNLPQIINAGGVVRVPMEKETRLFPIALSTIQDVLTEAIHRAGYVEKTKSGMNKLHVHSTRKFFRTQFGQAAGPDAAETIMGHSPGLIAIYRILEEGQAATLFMRHQYALRIFRDSETDVVRERVDRQADRMLALERENAALKEAQNARMGAMEKELDKVMRKLALDKFVETEPA